MLKTRSKNGILLPFIVALIFACSFSAGQAEASNSSSFTTQSYWSGYSFAYQQHTVLPGHNQYYVQRFNRAPVAYGSKVWMQQGMAKKIRLSAQDRDRDTLSYRVIRAPRRGVLSGTAPNLTYTPHPDYTGVDYFKFKVSDGKAIDTAWVKIWIKPQPQPTNQAPQAEAQSVATVAGNSVSLLLTGSDADDDILTFSFVDQPQSGVLSGTAPNLVYTPNAGFTGVDSFTFLSNDGQQSSIPATVSIRVETAVACSVTSHSSGSSPTDPSPASLSQVNYADFADLSHFALNGSAQQLSPNADQSLRLTQQLHQGGSAFIKQALPLRDENGFLASFSSAFSFKISQAIGAADADGQGADGLVFILQTMANNVGSNGGGIGYQGIENSLGIEFDTWNNGSVDRYNGNHIGVNINGSVRSTQLKSLPQRLNDGVTRFVWVDYDGASQQLAIRLAAQDQRPTNATLLIDDLDLPQILGSENAFIGFSSGTGAAGGQHEILTWQFINRHAPIDDCNNSNNNQAPIAATQTLQTLAATAVPITLSATDADNDALTYRVLTSPSNGVISGTAPNLVYTPNLGFVGIDELAFVANDGSIDSATATVIIQTTAVNVAPIAIVQNLQTTEDSVLDIVLEASDANDDLLSYTLLSQPNNGVLTGSLPNLRYLPNAHFTGNDSFQFTANDGLLSSAPVTVSIAVTAVNDAPIANVQTINAVEDTAIAVQLTASDLDGDALIYSIVSPTAQGVLSGTAPSLIYTPNPNVNGTDSLTFKVNDGQLDSTTVSVAINIAPVNDAPLAAAQGVDLDEDNSAIITLSGSDLEGDALTFNVVTQPTNGVLSGTAPNLVYTPNADFNGSDAFTFLVNDGGVDSAVETVAITVNSINDVPIADAQTITVDEDATTDIVLTGSDLEGDALTFNVATQPTNGVLSGTAPSLVYTPNADFNGSDAFTFLVNDGEVDSAVETIVITVNPVNDVPLADAQTITADEDATADIVLTGSDLEGDALTFSIVTQPANGVLSGTAPNLRYTPTANFNGNDTLQFSVNDGLIDSASVSISIVIVPINDVPTAAEQLVNTSEETAVNIILQGEDLEDDTLSYVLLSQPANGSLSGTAPNLVYTPAVDFNGNDSFTYQVNDGNDVSNSAIISIIVDASNDAPIANAQTITVDEDATADIVLTGSDLEGDALTFSITTQPTNGSLSGTAPNLVYTPNADFNGSDAFTFSVNDGGVDSAIATVAITVNSINDVPLADAQTIAVDEDATTDIVLTGSDLEGDALTFSIATQPTNGVLSGTAPNLSYTPNADFNGSDAFTFSVNDGGVDSAIATVAITVNSINDAPLADAQTIAVDEDVTTDIVLTGSDLEGDALTFSIVTQPANGSLSGTAPNLVYTPNADFNGSDAFTFSVNDGGVDSAVATVAITVNSINDVPIADAQTIAVDEDVTTDIVLTGSDLEGDALTFSIVTQPTNGVLSGTAPNLSYTPNADFNGSDAFTFLVNDGGVDSAVATVAITVNPINDAPLADTQTITVDEGVTAGIVLSGSDLEGDALTFNIVAQPANGVLSGAAPNLLYTSDADFNGTDSLTYQVNDGELDSNVATVNIVVIAANVPLNTAPTITSSPLLLATLAVPYSYNVVAQDADSDPLKFSLEASPAGMNIDADTGVITWLSDTVGDFAVTVLVDDGQGGIDQQAYTLTVVEAVPQITSEGTDFWLMFNINDRGDRIDRARQLYITSRFDAQITIEIPGLGVTQTHSVTAGGIETIILNDESDQLGHDEAGLRDGGIHVTSDNPIVVYLLNRNDSTTDATAILPTPALGLDHVVASYAHELNRHGSYFAVVAVEDDTRVSFVPTEQFDADGIRYEAGIPAEVSLNRGQTFQAVIAPLDFSGSTVTTDKPAAIFAGNNCTAIRRREACDHLVEQLLPANSLGSQFYSMPLAERLNGDTFRFYAIEDNTLVQLNGDYIVMLNRGEFYDLLIAEPSFISASKPLQVMQYSNSSGFDGVTSDPFMVTVPPAEQFVNRYVTSAPEQGFGRNYINIIALDVDKASVMLDGVFIDSSQWTPIANSGYVGAQIPVTLGAHEVISNQPIGVYSYGYDDFDSYGYLGGLAFSGDRTPAQLVIDFSSDTATVGTDVCVNVAVLDAVDDLIPQQQVRYQISNAILGVSAEALRLTNVNGAAEYCLQRGAVSVDEVTVTVGGLSETVSLDWQAYNGSESRSPVIESLPPVQARLRETYVYSMIATDPNNDVLTYALTEQPGGATIDAASGEIRLDIANDFIDAWITVAVTDATGESRSQRFRLAFDPQDNHFPLLDTPAQQIIAERSYTGILNGEDLDGDRISYSLITGPTGATVSNEIQSPRGRLEWSPTLADIGVHPIAILLEDARGGQTRIEYDLTVSENQAPFFTSTAPTEARVGGLFQYEIDVEDPDADPLNYEVSGPQGITISNSLGQIILSWRPETAQAGTHDITITAKDNYGGEVQQTFTVTVRANQAPEFTTTPVFLATIENNYTYDFRAADPDGDSIRYELVTAPDGLTRSGTRLSWRPTQAQIGEHEVAISADDQQGQVVTQRFIVTVSENQAPEFTTQPITTIVDSHNYFYRVNTQDPDAGGASYSLTAAPIGMTLSNRDLSWTPTPAQVGSHAVVLVADDGQGGLTEQAFTITVTANRSAGFTSEPQVQAIVEHRYFAQITAVDPDSDSVIYRLENAPDGMTLNNSRLDWTPNATQIGEHAVTVVADDRFGQVAQQNYVVTVFANQAPFIATEPLTFGQLNTRYFSRIRGTDPDGDSVRYRLASGPVGLTVSSTGDIDWAASAVQAGEHEIIIELTDDFGGNNDYRYTLTIVDTQLAITRAPSDQQLFVGQALVFDIDALHPDNRGITYEFLTAPAGANIVSNTGVIDWTPTVADIGANDITVRASASDGLEDTASFTITVVADNNQAPVITSTPKLDGRTDAQYSYIVTATDADNDALQYSLVTRPSGMTINSATGAITWNISDRLSSSVHPVTVRVTDEHGKLAEQSYDLAVEEFKFAPRINSQPNEFAKLGFNYRYAVQTLDVNDDVLSYTLNIAPFGMVVDAAGVIQWTPTATGVFPVELTVSDGELEAVQLFSVTVNPAEPRLSAVVSLDPPITEPNDSVRLNIGVQNNSGPAIATVLQDGVQVAQRLAPFTWFLRSDQPGERAVEVIIADTYETVTENLSFRVRDVNDAEPPVAEINDIIGNQLITSPIPVSISVNDSNLASWQLVSRELSSALNEFDVLAEGTSNITEQVVATFDPSLRRNGQHALIIIAKDLNGLETQSSVVIRLDEDLKVGNFSITFEDLNIPLAGMPISVRRTYDSRDRSKDQDFGFGWSLDFQNVKVEESRTLGLGWVLNEYRRGAFGLLRDFCVEPKGAPIVTVTLPDGDIEEFEVSANPTCMRGVPERNVRLEFTPIGDTQSSLEAMGSFGYFDGDNIAFDISDSTILNPSRYQLTNKADFVYDLDQAFGLRKVTDPNGNTLTYSDEGIIHSSGKRVDFTRDAFGRIVQVVDPSGQALNYDYDANGDLTGVTDRDSAQTTFTYNLSHGLIDIMDPLGRNIVKNIYDDNGRLIAQEDSDGDRTEFNHDVQGCTNVAGAGSAGATGGQGNTGAGSAGATGGQGNTVAGAGATGGECGQSVITDRNGNISFLYFDAEGNITSQVDALGNTTQFTHDANGNQLSQLDAIGNLSTATYNDRNDQLTQVDGLGNITTFAYNQRGQETLITDARGNVFNNTYDGVGNLLAVEDPEGNVAGNNINNQGLPSQTVDAVGNKTVFTYDLDGNKLTEVDAEGNIMRFTYDDNNNVLSETRTRVVGLGGIGGNGVATDETTIYEYDARDRVIKTTDALGNVTETEYDLVGNVVAEIDALGRRTEMDYDAYKRLLSMTYPDGTTMLKTYDPEGNLLTDTDRLGRMTTYEYDVLDRLIKTTMPDGSVNQTEYDAIGRVAAEIDANGNRTVYVYDAASRRISTTDALGNVTRYVYDEDGNQVGMTDANGNAMQYAYNSLDQKEQTTFANASTMREEFDALDRKISMTDQAGVMMRYEYDELNRLVKVIQNDVSGCANLVTDCLETAYTYDSVGNKLTQTDAEGRTTSWEYDALGRVISHSLPLGQVATMAYDEVGNLTQQTDFNGQTAVHSYDINDRLTQSLYADGLIETFVYDAIGNRTQAMKTENGVTTTTNYVFDNRDRLVSETQFAGTADETTLVYTYDAVGNRTVLTETQAGATRVTRYGFDVLNRLATVTDPEANVTSYQYDAAGNRVGMTHANGNKVDYVYDELNRLTTLNHLDSANTVLKGFAYTLHPTGRRTQITEDSGRATTYTYDNLYRLLTESITDPTNGDYNAEYSYDKVGNRVYETVDGVQTQYTVDDNDRLVQSGGNLYTHDGQGNTLTQTLDGVVTTYSYNAKHEMVGSNQAGEATAYLYNIDGIRIGKGNSTSQTLYTVDSNRDYAQVVSETTTSMDGGSAGNAGAVTMYTYGDDLISQLRDNAVSTYHYDGLGSVRALSDNAGTLTDIYDYEAFGEVLNKTGDTENDYLFTGEQFDTGLNQYYLRARYYNHAVGRFTQMDTWAGVNSDPQTLHKYLYGHADPVNNTDPTGNFSLLSLGTAQNIQSTLANLQAEIGFSIFDSILANGEAGNNGGSVARQAGASILISMLPIGILSRLPIFKSIQKFKLSNGSTIRYSNKKLPEAKELSAARAYAQLRPSTNIFIRGTNVQGGDAVIRGKFYELKTLEEATHGAVKGAINEARSRNKVQRVIIDGRKVGLTREDAIRGYKRYIGANPAMEHVSIITRGREVLDFP